MVSLYEELKALMSAKENKEKECRTFLKYVPDILFREGGIDIICDQEYRGHRGDSDYIAAGRGNESGTTCQRAYLWELKAPQCPLYTQDPKSSNRLLPSKELIEAENQLLNYYDEMRESGDFKSEFRITHSTNICIGGIIIGSEETKVRLKKEVSSQKKADLYEKADRCRKIFYRSDIRLMLWNTILEQLQPAKIAERIKNDSTL